MGRHAWWFGAAVATTFLVAAPRGSAQLTDLQAGRDFREATAAFGTGFSENIDVGDVDNDGDVDVVVANGGDGGSQANRLFLNEGGLQGGVQGVFTDVTSERFLLIPDDTSRDVELVDLDAPCGQRWSLREGHGSAISRGACVHRGGTPVIRGIVHLVLTTTATRVVS